MGVAPGQSYALDGPASARRQTGVLQVGGLPLGSPLLVRCERARRLAATPLRICAAFVTPIQAAFSCHSFEDAIPTWASYVPGTVSVTPTKAAFS